MGNVFDIPIEILQNVDGNVRLRILYINFSKSP